jgi:xylan 1,4-beta-xylosidase
MNIYRLQFSLICSFLLLAASAVFAQSSQNLTETRTINADMRRFSPLNTSFKACVGAGRANEGLRADWQRQLRIVKNECGFDYIRFHGLLTDDMGVYKEDKAGNPIYNWQYLDELYDFLLSINVKPFVELGFMPNALASGNKTVFWWKGNITQPKDTTKWKNLIMALVKHWTERYGAAEVRTWYFEVWNEPNLAGGFFAGTQADYFNLYHETVAAIKSVDNRYRVGGPATAGHAWIPEFINYCHTNNIPIDFISTHDYGATRGYLDVTGNVGTIINADKNSVSNSMRRSRSHIVNSKLPNLQLHYTEWSASYTPTDLIHDTYEEASYILNTVKRASPFVNSMSYWTFTDIFEEQGPRMTPFHGGFGLMNYEDIKKPAFYAFKYLNELAKYEIATNDSSAIFTRDKAGNVSALFWNCTIDHPDDSTNDQVYYKKILPAKSAGPLHINLRGLKPGKYRLETYKTGFHANDAYTAYLEQGAPSQLTRAQVAGLKKVSNDKPISTEVISIGANGTFNRTYQLFQNDVYLLKISRL